MSRAEREQIERLLDVICLADELLMEAKGAFPLPGDVLRDAYLIIRSYSGDDFHERKRRAAIARGDHRTQSGEMEGGEHG